MIEIKNLVKIYKDKVALNVPYWVFEKGRKYALIGANGSGKSTLLKLIAKIIPASSGSISGAKQIVYMPQKPLGFSLSVTNNMKLVGGKDYLPILEKLDITHLSKKKAARLSGGETQRVALARVIAAGGDILLFDEPTSAMDIESASLAESLISQESLNKTMIFATHSIQQAERLADVIIFMYNGEIIESLPAKDFRTSCQDERTKQFISRY